MTDAWWNGDGGIHEIPLPDGVAGRLWLCGKHRIAPDVESLLDETGASLVVCLTERAEIDARYPHYVDWLDRHRGTAAIWFPIHDLGTADHESSRALYDEIAGHLRAGTGVVVHCAAGIGRAGTTAIATLMVLGVPLEEARHHVRQHRPMAGPEAGPQVEALQRLENEIAPRTLVQQHQPLLGTFVELRVGTVAGATARHAESASDRMVDEIRRLEAVFTIYDESSELSRWREGDLGTPGPELTTVLALARAWWAESGGAFNPSVGRLTALWRSAESVGEPPSDPALVDVVASIATLPYDVVDGVVIRTGDCSSIDLNALAKGWIVDRAVDLGMASDGVGTVTVNAGGDLLHRGGAPLAVGIENPHRPYDNEPPLARVEITESGLATSGRARRGFRIGGQRFGHVLDPRTGRTTEAVASITVVAQDAATSDALATVLGVGASEDERSVESALLEADHRGAACFIVTADGRQHANDRWRSIAL